MAILSLPYPTYLVFQYVRIEFKNIRVDAPLTVLAYIIELD